MIDSHERLSMLMPRNFLGLGHKKLSHIGDLTKPYFVAVGCSVVGGDSLSVDYKDSWVNQVAAGIGMEHINLGFDGSSLEYQYEKIQQCEKILPDSKFILWMQSPPWRSHHMRFRNVIGDGLARIKLDSALYRNTESLAAQWRKLLAFYDLAKKNTKILFTNTWMWDAPLLYLLESKMRKTCSRYHVNTKDIIDRGKDGLHPGPDTHKHLATEMIQSVFTHFPQLKRKSVVK